MTTVPPWYWAKAGEARRAGRVATPTAATARFVARAKGADKSAVTTAILHVAFPEGPTRTSLCPSGKNFCHNMATVQYGRARGNAGLERFPERFLAKLGCIGLG